MFDESHHCSQIELKAYIEGTCGDQLAGEISIHLDSCADCQTLLDQIDRERVGEFHIWQSHPDTDAASLIERIEESIGNQRLPIGDELLSCVSRLKFVSHLASGGLGDVLLYDDMHLKRRVAVKTLRHDKPTSTVRVTRFRQEYEITSVLRSPGIPQVYTHGVFADGREFFSMSWIDGSSLCDRIASLHAGGILLTRSDVSFREILRIFSMICRTVGTAHQQGIVHRDLKPDNVLLDSDGNPFVIDWGLAGKLGTRYVHDDAEAQSESGRLTLAGKAIGALLYMSPEQASGDVQQLDERTDIYGLGAILFELLTGEAIHGTAASRNGSTSDNLPIEQRAIHQQRLLYELSQGAVRDPRVLRKDVPKELASICLAATNPDRRLRYAHAETLARDIDNWISGIPVSTHRYGVLGLMLNWIARNPTICLVTGICVVVVLVISVVASSRLNQVSNANNVALTNIVDGVLTACADLRITTTRDLRGKILQQVDYHRDSLQHTENTDLRRRQIQLAIDSAKVWEHAFYNRDDLQRAEKLLRKALDEARELVQRSGATPEDQLLLTDSLSGLAAFLAVHRRNCIDCQTEAQALAQQAIERLLSLPANAVASSSGKNRIVEAKVVQARTFFRNWNVLSLNAHDLALNALVECETLCAENPENKWLQLQEARLATFIGLCVHKSKGGGWDRRIATLHLHKNEATPQELVMVAQGMFDRASNTMKRLAALDAPGNAEAEFRTEVQKALMDCLTTRSMSDALVFGFSEDDLVKQQAATRISLNYVTAQQIAASRCDAAPSDEALKLDLAGIMSDRAEFELGCRTIDVTTAIQLREQCCEIVRPIAKAAGAGSPASRLWSQCQTRLAKLKYDCGDANTATELVREVEQLCGDLHEGDTCGAEFFGYVLLLADARIRGNPERESHLLGNIERFLSSYRTKWQTEPSEEFVEYFSNDDLVRNHLASDPRFKLYVKLLSRKRE